ncbi:hypothetical protein WA026_007440 [Henosepilachna vigintioctopunctata]|uniref:Peptidase S1 domain-containing protein n=1 Tax=Henosepilachna vigintioctopunctata TaxID=420089 RepID=A0AAW1UXA8_9CUCU
MPDDYKRYLRSDKICAEVLDKDTGLCAGDSGGGMIVRNDENKRYYLRGIVSINPQVADNCNSTTLTLLTKISTYLDFMKSIELSHSD